MADDINHASGRFLLRLDPGLHARLKQEAAAASLSLNEFCVRRLAAPHIIGVGGELLARAAGQFGSALDAVVAFGSWARGHAASDSDVDVLLVLDRSIALERSLYHAWDAHPLELEGHRVEPHVAHLPLRDAALSGLWCELAVDGLVLYDRDLSTSRYLGAVRTRVAAGEVIRRVAHGQPYWSGAA